VTARAFAALVVTAALVAPAAAEPTVLRFATVAPEGSGWARLFHIFTRELAAESHGEVTAKGYYGGIAGNETEMLDRLRRGQLDAVMSGGMLCMELSPSVRVVRLLGLLQSRDEAKYVLNRLRPRMNAELAKAGFHNVGEAGLGSDMIFSRRPITSMAELRRTRLWLWDLDEPMKRQLVALGVPGVPLPVEQAARAYEDGKIDGFLAIPTAALAFQWSAQARHLSLLRVAYLPACMFVTNRAWDALSNEGRIAVTTASAKLQARLEDLGRQQDEALLGGLFKRQGVNVQPAGAGFISEFREAASAVRGAVRDKLIPGQVIDRVTTWLADYRAEHGVQARP
jgi:TRAP-type C4-dicarboxylate transport system substrate-binding protein